MKAAMLGDNCIDVYRMIDGREVNRQYPTGNVVETMKTGPGWCGSCGRWDWT